MYDPYPEEWRREIVESGGIASYIDQYQDLTGLPLEGVAILEDMRAFRTMKANIRKDFDRYIKQSVKKYEEAMVVIPAGTKVYLHPHDKDRPYFILDLTKEKYRTVLNEDVEVKVYHTYRHIPKKGGRHERQIKNMITHGIDSQGNSYLWKDHRTDDYLDIGAYELKDNVSVHGGLVGYTNRYPKDKRGKLHPVVQHMLDDYEEAHRLEQEKKAEFDSYLDDSKQFRHPADKLWHADVTLSKGAKFFDPETGKAVGKVKKDTVAVVYSVTRHDSREKTVHPPYLFIYHYDEERQVHVEQFFNVGDTHVLINKESKRRA